MLAGGGGKGDLPVVTEKRSASNLGAPRSTSICTETKLMYMLNINMLTHVHSQRVDSRT